jgi:SAM-dependent methyltransferase
MTGILKKTYSAIYQKAASQLPYHIRLGLLRLATANLEERKLVKANQNSRQEAADGRGNAGGPEPFHPKETNSIISSATPQSSISAFSRISMSNHLKILSCYKDMMDIIAKYMKLQGKERKIDILEAGCGRMWEFTGLGIPYKLTGVDADKDALEFRKNEQKDLDEAIFGDLRTVDLPQNSFDIIYSSYVLEHIAGTEAVLKKFANWLRPGGILIIKLPDGESVSGFLTHATPHWFHVFVYRYIKGKRMAGTPGHGPYRTYYEKAISKKSILEFAENNQLQVKEVCGYHNDISRSFNLPSRLIQLLSLGRLHADYADIMYIFEKERSSAI